MYILNEKNTEIVNADFVERFCVVEKSDAALIVASYGTDRPPITLARYEGLKEAQNVLEQLYGAITAGQNYFDMPVSRLFANENMKRDARTKRKGGS